MSDFVEGMDEAMAEFGFDPIVPFSIDWDIPFTHALFIFCVSLIISIYPAIKIYTLNAVKSMRS